MEIEVPCSHCGHDLVRPGQSSWNNGFRGFWLNAGGDIDEWQGKEAWEALPSIQKTLDNLNRDPEHFQQMSENPFAILKEDTLDVSKAIEILEQIRDACARDPYAVIKISR